MSEESDANKSPQDSDTDALTTSTEPMNPTSMNKNSLKYISLVLLTLQNALLILVMRYSRTQEGDSYYTTTAVIMSELIKFLACLGAIFYQEEFSIFRWAQYLNENIFQQPIDCLKISVSAIVYTLQNNLLYVAVSNLEAATYQVTYQLKILTTAIFSVVILRKELTKMQWFSLLVLFVGVSAVQLQPHDEKSGENGGHEQNPMLGLLAVVVSCFMSGFAGIYLEKMLKGTPQTLLIRNVQLGFIGVIIGIMTMIINDYDGIKTNGVFFGYNGIVVFVICLQSFGGLMVAVVVKYADNILKGFATSASIIISCIVSLYFFDFQLSIQFSVGATLVMVSVYLYSKYAPTQSLLPQNSKE